jgi:hypothetical protein
MQARYFPADVPLPDEPLPDGELPHAAASRAIAIVPEATAALSVTLTDTSS